MMGAGMVGRASFRSQVGGGVAEGGRFSPGAMGERTASTPPSAHRSPGGSPSKRCERSGDASPFVVKVGNCVLTHAPPLHSLLKV